MRIIKKLFLSLVIAGLGFATLAGCVSLENAERISIVEMPTTTFVKNQETSGNLMKVLITDSEGNDVVLTLSYPDEKGNVSAQRCGSQSPGCRRIPPNLQRDGESGTSASVPGQCRSHKLGGIRCRFAPRRHQRRNS